MLAASSGVRALHAKEICRFVLTVRRRDFSKFFRVALDLAWMAARVDASRCGDSITSDS